MDERKRFVKNVASYAKMLLRMRAVPNYLYLALFLGLLASVVLLHAFFTDQSMVNVLSTDKVKNSDKPAVVGYMIRGPKTTNATIEVILLWYGERQIDRDLVVRLRLVDKHHSFSFVMDHYPTIPTTKWSGFVDDGPHVFSLPPSLVGEESVPIPPIVPYELVVGLEDPVTQEKIPLANEEDTYHPFFYKIGTLTIVNHFLFQNLVGTSIFFLFVVPIFTLILKKRFGVNIKVLFLAGFSFFILYIVTIFWFNPQDVFSLSIPFSSMVLAMALAILYIKNSNFPLNFLIHLIAIVFLSGFFTVGRLALPFGLRNDIFFHMANVQSVLNGEFYQDYAIAGLPSHYTKGFHSMIAFASILSGLPYTQIMVYFPIVIRALTVPTFYFMGKAVRGKTLGVVFAFLGTFYDVWLRLFGILAHPRGIVFLTPLIIYTFIKSSENRKMSLLCAILLAAQFYIHMIMFFPLFIGIVAYIVFARVRHIFKKRQLTGSLRPLRQLVIPALVLILTLPHYLPIVLMRTPVVNLDPLVYYWTVQWTTTFETVLFSFGLSSDRFDVFSSFKMIPDVFTVLAFLGFFACIFRAKRGEKVVLVMFASALFVRASYLFSIPTFVYSNPIYYFWQVENQLWLLNAFFASYFLVFFVPFLVRVVKSCADTRINVNIKFDEKTAFVLMFILLSPAVYIMPIQDYALMERDSVVFDQYHIPNFGNLYALSQWISNSTNSNETVLADPLVSYWLTAFTGRKMVALRWFVYVSPFVNQTNRNEEAMEIYQTSNLTRMMTLIKKYTVKYIVVDEAAPDNFQKHEESGLFSLVYTDHFVYKVYKVIFHSND